MTELQLKNLESLLRTELGNELIVESYVTKDLLPPGENYGSKLISVDAVIRRGAKKKSEDLHLVAKLPPPTQFQLEMFDSPYTFGKEIFMYAKILPFYRDLEIKNGVDEKDAFNIGPVYYGSRLSLIPDAEFDADAAILLENLKCHGYYCTERRLGCDLPHARLAIKAVATFHALGMATKEKDPEFFEVLKVRSKCVDFKNPEEWEKVFKKRIQDVAEDGEISHFLENCVKTVQSSDVSVWLAAPSEPWSTVIHSDFWANNMLFIKENGAKEPTDIKFIDYQNYLFLSPTRELAFFLGSGLNHETMDHFDELIDLYYDTLMEKLKSLNCDVDKYSRETFNEKLNEDGRIEFAHCLCMLKVVTMDVAADDPDAHNVKNLLENDDRGDRYVIRLRDLVLHFQKRGWLLQ